MSRCSSCSTKKERPCAHEDQTKEYYEAIMPAMRHVAYQCGYALAVHGSLKTDIDIVACPWREHAINAAALAEKLRALIEQIIGIGDLRGHGPTKKPAGRLAWSIHMTPIGYPGPYVDLSVMPSGTHENT